MTGSGRDGLILRADVEQALRAAAAQEAIAQEATLLPPATLPDPTAQPASPTRQPDSPPPTPGRPHPPRRRNHPHPLRGIRGAVADKLSRSRREIPDATCWVDADATELMRARAAMNAAGGPKISVPALLARICTAALARFPELNSSLDMEAREIVRFDRVHLGFAAQRPSAGWSCPSYGTRREGTRRR